MTESPQKAPDKIENVKISFERGVPPPHFVVGHFVSCTPM